LSYQIGSQGYVMNRVHEEGGDRDRQYIDAETELGREVALCIEQREKALQELQVEAALLRKEYLEAPLLTRRSRLPFGSFSSRPSSHKRSSFSTDIDIDPVDHGHEHEQREDIVDERVMFMSSDIDRLQPLLAKMSSLRRATMEFADAYGAWYVQCTLIHHDGDHDGLDCVDQSFILPSLPHLTSLPHLYISPLYLTSPHLLSIGLVCCTSRKLSPSDARRTAWKSTARATTA
jgi:hypothetical protein